MQVARVVPFRVLCGVSCTNRRRFGAAGRVAVVAAVFALLFGLFPSVVTADGVTWTPQTTPVDSPLLVSPPWSPRHADPSSSEVDPMRWRRWRLGPSYFNNLLSCSIVYR